MIDDGKGIKNLRVALLAQRVYLFLFFKLFLIWKGFKLIISRYLFNNFNMFILRIKKNLKKHYFNIFLIKKKHTLKQIENFGFQLFKE
jgi:hypothetical protein